MDQMKFEDCEIDCSEEVIEKLWHKHNVSLLECEEVFRNWPIVGPDTKHSFDEIRHIAFGQAYSGRFLRVVFVVRGATIRVITARDMNAKEIARYEQTGKEDPK